MPKQPNYAEYINHPRYGKSPRYTGFDPNPNDVKVYIHWNTGIVSDLVKAELKKTWGDWPPAWAPEPPIPVPGTAIEADPSRQILKPVPVTHYYDLDTLCRGCNRRFIFFAEEQKFWYEELHLPLEAQAVRCCECRKHERWLAQQKKRYDTLFHVQSRTPAETLEMVDCCLTLLEQAIFHPKQTHHVRQLLNSLPTHLQSTDLYQSICARLQSFEATH